MLVRGGFGFQSFCPLARTVRMRRAQPPANHRHPNKSGYVGFLRLIPHGLKFHKRGFPPPPSCLGLGQKARGQMMRLERPKPLADVDYKMLFPPQGLIDKAIDVQGLGLEFFQAHPAIHPRVDLAVHR